MKMEIQIIIAAANVINVVFSAISRAVGDSASRLDLFDSPSSKLLRSFSCKLFRPSRVAGMMKRPRKMCNGSNIPNKILDTKLLMSSLWNRRERSSNDNNCYHQSTLIWETAKKMANKHNQQFIYLLGFTLDSQFINSKQLIIIHHTLL